MLTIKFTSDDPDALRRALSGLAGFCVCVWNVSGAELLDIREDGALISADGTERDLADITELEVP